MKLGEAVDGLHKLEAEPDDTHHKVFRVYCPARHVVGLTRVSHKPASMQLGARLVSEMAHQLSVTTKLWKDVAGCTQGRTDYLLVTDHEKCRP